MNPLQPSSKLNPESNGSPSAFQEYQDNGKRVLPNQELHTVESVHPTEEKTMKMNVIEDKPITSQVNEIAYAPAKDSVLDGTVSEISYPEAVNESEKISISEESSDDADDSDTSSTFTTRIDRSEEPTAKMDVSQPIAKNDVLLPKTKMDVLLPKTKMNVPQSTAKKDVSRPITKNDVSSPTTQSNNTNTLAPKKSQKRHYSKDHQSNSVASHVMTTVANLERQVLNKMGKRLPNGTDHFNEVLKQFPSPVVDGKRPQLTAEQKQLFNSMCYKREEEKYCQGGQTKKSYRISRVTRNPGQFVFRKFVGNTEVVGASIDYSGGDDREDSRLEPFCEKCNFTVTSIMVTT